MRSPWTSCTDEMMTGRKDGMGEEQEDGPGEGSRETDESSLGAGTASSSSLYVQAFPRQKYF